MRRLIAAVILIISAFVLSFTVSHFEKKALCELHNSVADICEQADRGEAEGEKIADCIHLWEERRTFLSSVLKHADVDAMSMRFAMMQTYYENGEKELYIEVCDELLVFIDVVLDGERLSFRNLF